MSKRDAVVMGSRVLSVFLIVWALAEVSYLPEFVHSYIHYGTAVPSASIDYWRHYYLLRSGFLVTRIVGYSLLARWFYQGSPGVASLLLPTVEQDAL